MGTFGSRLTVIHFHIQVAILEESLDIEEAARGTGEEGRSWRSLLQDRGGLQGVRRHGFGRETFPDAFTFWTLWVWEVSARVLFWMRVLFKQPGELEHLWSIAGPKPYFIRSISLCFVRPSNWSSCFLSGDKSCKDLFIFMLTVIACWTLLSSGIAVWLINGELVRIYTFIDLQMVQTSLCSPFPECLTWTWTWSCSLSLDVIMPVRKKGEIAMLIYISLYFAFFCASSVLCLNDIGGISWIELCSPPYKDRCLCYLWLSVWFLLSHQL